MKTKITQFILLIFLVSFLFTTNSLIAQQQERAVILIVNGPDAGWLDGDFEGKLLERISSSNRLKMIYPEDLEIIRDQSQDLFSRSELLEYGLKNDCRYILWCDINSEKLSTKKHFTIPFLLSQRRITAELEIKYYLLDCFRGKLLTNEKVRKRKVGASSLQILDPTSADPALHTTYLEKKELFSSLEHEAAKIIFAELERISKQR